MIEVQSPGSYDQYRDKFMGDKFVSGKFKVFLGGSIEMGAAEPWQERVVAGLKDLDIVLLNPRRADWDSTWEQRAHDANFSEQVNWELDALEAANWIIFYFDPNTKSPITLMELGLMAKPRARVLVCCPDGFWRKGNVEIVCQRKGIEMVDTIDEMIEAIAHYHLIGA